MDKQYLTGYTSKGIGNSYSIIASTEAIDRDGEVIKTSAWEKSLPKFLELNPVLLYGHDYKSKPIGRALSGSILGKELRMEIEFAPTEEGQEIKALYDGKFLNSWSVGFVPKDWTADTKTGGRIYSNVELLEVSAVPVPSNSQANMLRTIKEAGLSVKSLSQWFEDAPEDCEDEEEEARELLKEIADISNEIDNLNKQKMLQMQKESPFNGLSQ